MKKTNELCSDNEVLRNIDECKSAVGYLKKRGSEIIFTKTESDSRYPKGCYKYENGEAYWNTHRLGSSNQKGQPICKS